VNRRTKLLAAAAAALAVAAVAAALAVGARRNRRPRAEDRGPAIALQAGEVAPEPSVWIDVHAPAAVFRAARANPWLARALSEPLGQGFSSGWTAFLGTRGTDLAGAFEGTVIDLVATKLLADPFRVVLYAGPGATGVPAVIVPKPSSSSRAAFELLEAAARSGRFEAARCPGEAADREEKITVSRWLVADHAVFAGEGEDRLALARNPIAVVQALCAAPPDAPAEEDVDVSISFARAGLGREAELAAALLGLGPAPRFLFAAERDRLAPRGIAGELAEPNRLAAAAPPEGLLRAIPGDAGLLVLATLNLPDPLDRAALKEHLAKTYRGKLAARTVALVWNPRGAAARDTEVALVWPERDTRALLDAFSGPNRMIQRRACGHVLLASTGALAGAMERACSGKAPSLLNAAPAVVQGVREPASLEVGLNLGLVLSRLLGDAYAAERGAAKGVSPEIESARRLLEELPFIGLRGVAKDGALVPGGFRP
jgi:hypothetical protein